jgi:glycosyltransferase 2 family protein
VKRWLRVLVSAALIGLLIWVGNKQHVMARLRSAPPGDVALAIGVLAAAWLINSVRWGLLLRVVQVRENPAYLASLYFIGMFFSSFLPTGAGGDAVRMLELYRRGHKPASVVVATLQERLLGMGVSMLIGLGAAMVYGRQLPVAARTTLLLVPALSVAAVALFLYPRVPLALAGSIGRWGPLASLGRWPIVHRLIVAVGPAARLPPLTPRRLTPILLVTLAGDLLSFAVWWILGRAAGVSVPFGGYCLVVPLVWVISMAPSLGGVGVREGGFVWLMKMFNVPIDRSLSVAALYLIVQTILAGVGGLMVLVRVWRGNWKPAAKAHG